MKKPVTILLLGANGQLGRCIADVCPEHYSLIRFTREELDIRDSESIKEVFEKHSIDVCINCAAYTAVDKAETEVDLSREINTSAVSSIASACRDSGALLLHYSTDYVYAASESRRPLSEKDATDPRSVYALTKYEGELEALTINPNTVVIRTSWVYSEYGHNFVKTMLSLADRGIHPSVVNDQYGCPTYARDIATASFDVIEKFQKDKAGLYNFSNSGQTTWKEFAEAIYQKWERDINVSSTTTEAYGAPAFRPAYSVLDCSKFIKTFDHTPRSWQNALEECHLRMTSMAQNHN